MLNVLFRSMTADDWKSVSVLDGQHYRLCREAEK